ncbi:MAG: hypothetical protein AMXMBFR78_11370 [Rubrivivax sp.]
MDIVRRIAIETADMPFGYELSGLDGIDAATFGQHVIWMTEAGLLRSHVQEYLSSEPPKAHVTRLTWAGCEFADAVASDTLWAKAKASVIKPSASWTFGLLTEWLKAEISQGFPTLLGQP